MQSILLISAPQWIWMHSCTQYTQLSIHKSLEG